MPTKRRTRKPAVKAAATTITAAHVTTRRFIDSSSREITIAIDARNSALAFIDDDIKRLQAELTDRRKQAAATRVETTALHAILEGRR